MVVVVQVVFHFQVNLDITVIPVVQVVVQQKVALVDQQLLVKDMLVVLLLNQQVKQVRVAAAQEA